MKRVKEIVKVEASGRNKLELELVKFKIFEFVEQLRIELSQGNSMIEKYIDSKEKNKN